MVMADSSDSPLIVLSAGEASGDLLGAHLMQALRRLCPQVRFAGIGGPKMRAEGMDCWYRQEVLAVRGYVEVLRHLPRILAVRRGLLQRLRQARPAVFVGIDAPDFNLGVAGRIRAEGVAALHYVSPSVWAWRRERVHRIVRQVDEVLCLFPMEPPLYREAGGRARFVGHPLAQMMPLVPDRAAARRDLGLSEGVPVFALLPGSRVSEVHYMAPVFFETAALIRARYPDAVFLVPYATEETGRLAADYAARCGGGADIRLLPDATQRACVAADGVLAASGTAALEVALCKRPMVISYKVSPLTYAWVKRKIRVPFVGLPNILLNRAVVPELLQDDACPQKLADALAEVCADAEALQAAFTDLHRLLRRDTAKEAAEAVLSAAGVVS